MTRIRFQLVPATLGVVAACAALGCALGGVPRQELPEAPIAFSYRTQEEARRRAEDQQEGQEQAVAARRPVEAARSRGGYADLVASEDNLAEIFDMVLGRTPEAERRHLGRLALLDPRSGSVDVVVAARRGSIPLAWSQDHQRLLFAQPDGNDAQIYEYELADATVRPVTTGPPAHTQGCYGPEGRIVVTAFEPHATPPRSWIAVSETGGRRPFRPLSEGPSDHSPACDVRSGRVVFVREGPPPRADLFVADATAGGEPRRLSPGRHPSFSADGRWIAFAAPAGRELRLWRVRPDGTGRAPIGRGVRHEMRPTLSPDGHLVVYVAAEERPRRHLYLRRFDGTGDRILFADGDGEYPVW